jgi:hypothetical protein
VEPLIESHGNPGSQEPVGTPEIRVVGMGV